MLKHIVFKSALIALICSASIATHARADEHKQINVPAGDLIAALKTLAQQSGIDLVYRSDQLEGLHTQGIAGTFSPQEAVTKLLVGTPLILKTDASGAMLITLPRATTSTSILLQGADSANTHATPESGIAKERNQKGFWSRLGLLQAEPASRADAQFSSENQISENSSESSQKRIVLEEILVTGSRLRRGAGEEIAPVTVFDRARIEQTGAAGLPDVLKYSTQQTFTKAEAAGLGGEQYAQLRGLPAGSTVVLINGRRTVPSANNVNQNGFDLNMIPLAAIERVEILTGSASAMYGADAVGGVLNVILRQDISRPMIEMRYGGASGGADERRASIATGYVSERFRSSVFADYYDRGALLGEERDRWSNQDYRRFGGTDQRAPNANPGAFVSSSAANLPGLPSRFALVRPGASSSGLTAADFIPVATDAELRTESLRRFEAITMDQERKSAAAFAEFEITESITAFAEGLYSDAEVRDQTNPFTASTLIVPVSNPFNPFGQSVGVRYLFEDVGPRRTVLDEDMFSATAGFKGRPGSWDWEVSALSTKSTSTFTQNLNAVNTTQATCLLSDPATRAAGACRGVTEALNVFADGPGGSQALLSSLIDPPSVFEGESAGTQVAAFMRGALFSLPGGSVDLVVGGSASSEKIESGQIAPVTTRTIGDRDSSAAFAEARVPLMSAAMGIPAVHKLAVEIAVRHDQYSDFGDSVNPQYGLLWAPTASIAVTASYGTSFSAPSVWQLSRPRMVTSNVQVMDPQRGNEAVFIDVIRGGNPNLDPEEGRSFSAGINFLPQQAAGLRLSAHYWRVELTNRVAALGTTQILSDETLFQRYIERAAPDVSGLPGRLLSLDISAVNYARLDTSGIDVLMSYEVDTAWGRFSPRLSATWTMKHEAKDFPDLPAEERVGIAYSGGTSGTIPRWRAVAVLGWEKQGFGLSASGRYTHGFMDSTFVAGRTVATSRSVPSYTLFDLQASVDFDDMTAEHWPLLSGTKISAGVQNLFDKEPPFVDSVTSSGYDPTQGDLIGRSVYVNLSKKF